MPLAFALSMLIGMSLALFGAGGSILTMPVLVYVVGLDAHHAAATSLVVVGGVALVGAALRWRTASLQTALVFGATGMLGTFPGAWLNHHVPPAAILLGFAVTVLAAAVRMARPGASRPAATTARAPFAAVLLGFVVGVATGFFGVGGGFLIVPALTLLLDVPIERAIATSLVVIALNSGAALGAHSGQGGIDWRLGGELTLAALAGAGVAIPLGARLHGPAMQRAFAAMLALVGTGMLVDTMRGFFA